METTEFKASNGYTLQGKGRLLRIHDDLGVNTLTEYDFINEEDKLALRELFQHQRDEELGRWRWPENQNIVVVLDKKNYSGDGKRWVSVYDEREMGKSSWFCADTSSKMTRGREPLHDAAHDYFAAHPVSKPWHDAKPREVWLITDDRQEVFEMTVVEGSSGLEFFTHHRLHATTYAGITAARRIWPEA